MRHFRPALILASVLLGTLMTACGSSSNTVAANCTPADGINTGNLNLVLPGKLTIATDATYPPQEYIDKGKFTGMEIDLGNEMAKRLCLQANFNNVQFSTIIPGITYSTPGQQYYDMSISAFTITSDRQKQVDMIPYFTAGETFVVPTGNPKHITGLDASICGLAVTYEAGTTEEMGIQQVNSTTCASNPVKKLVYPGQDQALASLLNGSADASFQDSPVSAYYVKLNAGKLDQVANLISPAPEGIVVRNDNAPFENAIKQVLSDMRADGTYLKILTTWQLQTGAYPPLS
jgi:polar amino acid transport system substrate-binding protein